MSATLGANMGETILQRQLADPGRGGLAVGGLQATTSGLGGVVAMP